MIKVLIVEDEPLAARRLKNLLLAGDFGVQVIENTESIESTVAWLKANPSPDLIFMDIHLEDGDSFEIWKQVQIQAPVIFTTAYEQYAIQAFEVQALHYLLKPIKTEELAAAMSRYKHMLVPASNQVAGAADMNANQETKDRLLIRVGQQFKVLQMTEVAYFFASNKLTYVVLRTGKRYPLDQTIEKIETLCDPLFFFRLNRQYLAHFDAIGDVRAYSKSRVIIHLKPEVAEKVVVSTMRTQAFKKWLGNKI
jgi:two-component system response regulator LytT